MINMSQQYIEFNETDFGSKSRAEKATGRVPSEITAQTKWRVRVWWENVLETARILCIQYGCIDTWTLYGSIRIEDVGVITGGPPLYEVAIGPHVELINSQIVAGGLQFINPKTGNPCNYAESVHEGTGRNLAKGPRRFLADAVDIHMTELLEIINKGIDRTVNTVWVGQ